MANIKSLSILIFLLLLISSSFLNGYETQSQEVANPRHQLAQGNFEQEQSSSISSSGCRGNNDELTLIAAGQGAEIDSNYGFALTKAGDLNGDGFDDIIVGAPYMSTSSKANVGEVYIFYGAEDFAQKNLDGSEADVIISGKNINDLFGWSICIPGDIDGDKINDILVGAPGISGANGKIYGFYAKTIATSSALSVSSADLIIQSSSSGERFGFTVVALGDVNSDQNQDIMVGAPGKDRAYLLYGPTFGTSDRSTFLGPGGSQFGTSVSGGTDLNNDGHFDFVIGAPVGTVASEYKGQVLIFFGFNNFYLQDSFSIPTNILSSDSTDDLFGQHLSSQADIDKDGFYDIIVSAPGDDSVYIYYGKTIIERYLYPYLWNMPGDVINPVDFSSGVYNDVGQNNDVNTFGLGNGDDGWDWGPNEFGSSSGADMDHIYGAREEPNPPYADAEGPALNDVSKLEVIVGRSNTGSGPSIGWFSTGSDSGAWGIEFKITSQMFENITKGAKVQLDMEWEAHDALKVFGFSGGTEERCYVKARFTSATTSTYLGTNMGGDSTAELFFSESSSSLNNPFPSMKDRFELDITNLIETSGNYYLDFGARLEKTEFFTTKNTDEGIVAFFDNISITIETIPITHSVKIKGVSQSQFGEWLTIIDDLNNDGFDELGIGAPYSNLAGTFTGAIYIFYGELNLRTQINANEAQMIITGFEENENFGMIFTNVGNLNGDGYGELLVGAPSYLDKLGKIYIFSPAKQPEISIINPIGGIIVEGNLILTANASDFENEIDRFGVSFYFSEYTGDDTSAWNFIAQVIDPIIEYTNTGLGYSIFRYSTQWDTTEVRDGIYHIKAEVMDNTYLSAFATSDVFEVNNPDAPIIEILSPAELGQTYSGIIPIKTNCTDADGDLNFSSFYYSKDGGQWSYIGTDYSADGDIYQIDWDTEDLGDGDYYVKVWANDTRGLNSEAISVMFTIHNPGPPTISFIEPAINDTLKGYSRLKVSVKDKDDNIADSGVLFSYSRDRSEWIVIDSATTVEPDLSYSIFWDTLRVPDGYYWLSAYVEDTTNLSGSVIFGPIKVDNPTPPSIQLEQLDSPIAGKVRLRAICFDDDSPISSEGVTFYFSIDDSSWKLLDKVFRPSELTNTQVAIYELEWDTNTNETPDSINYRLRATVKDITSLQNESIIGPFEVNNPDLPTVTLDHPKNGDKIKGNIMLGAYAVDPDNDIDARGVSFYISSNGRKWYLIDSISTPTTNSTLFQLQWDTKKLPNGNYKLKVEVVDKTALKAEYIANIEINNDSEYGFLNVSAAFWTGSIISIIIIILLIVFLVSLLIKRRKAKQKKKAEEEREELVKQIKDELFGESARRYPAIQPAARPEMPILPAFGHSATPYQTTATAVAVTAGSRPPMLPPHHAVAGSAQPAPATQPEAGIAEGTQTGAQGPYTGTAQAGPVPKVAEHPYQPSPTPKIGLTPDDMEKSTSGVVHTPKPRQNGSIAKESMGSDDKTTNPPSSPQSTSKSQSGQDEKRNGGDGN